MINVAVCDDDTKQLELICKYLNSFQAENQSYLINLYPFTDPFTLCDTVEQKGGYDIYLLDVVMPNMTGIECAEHIRRLGDKRDIIFLTTSREYAVDAFDVNACGYLIKPLEKEKLYTLLQSLITKLTQKRPPLPVKLAGGGMHTYEKPPANNKKS